VCGRIGHPWVYSRLFVFLLGAKAVQDVDYDAHGRRRRAYLVRLRLVSFPHPVWPRHKHRRSAMPSPDTPPTSRGQAGYSRRRSEAVSCFLVVGVPGSLVGEAELTCPGARPLIATKTSFSALRGRARVAHSRGACFDRSSPSLRRRPQVASFFSPLPLPPSCGPTHLGGRRTRSCGRANSPFGWDLGWSKRTCAIG
jgi:hypothetical protein